MKKSWKLLVFLSIIALYIVGNNQIVSASTSGEMKSQSSIYFDKAYTPPEVDPIIPGGDTKVPIPSDPPSLPKSPSKLLPSTGSSEGHFWQSLGFSLLVSSLVLIVYPKKKEN